MAALRFDAEQRFTCAGCARCCHAEVVITPAEHAAYTREGAARWFREWEATTEGTERDPFVALPGRAGWFRIRRRADGTCGFLSAQNRCRLHEELGGERKPLVCRMFPFAVHSTEREPVVTASFTCPTIVSNEGQPVPEQARAIGALRNEWGRTFGVEPRPFLLVSGKPMSGRALDAIRGALQRILSAPAPAPDGAAPLARNVRKIAAWLEDLSRPKVTRLPPDDLAEYVIVTGRYAAESDRQLPVLRPSRLARVRERGLLFVGGAAAMQRRGIRTRWRMVRLLLHAHGLGPAVGELDVAARRRVRLDVAETAPLLRHYLRAAIETLGTGRRPVLGELARSAAVMNVAIALGAMDAVRAGRAAIGAASLREGLVRASELDHLQGVLAAIVDSFAGGPESFLLLAESLES
jgi:Fe-S-cluster containining protein